MSILSDLDPKNAKIPATSSPRQRRNTAWILAPLLLCGGVFWLYLAQPSDLVGNVDSTLRSSQGADVSAPLLASAADTSPPPAATNHEEIGSALILSAPAMENAAVAADESPNVFQALRKELDATPGAGTDKMTKPATQQKKASNKKSPKVGRAKRATRSASAATGNGRTESAATPSERDISIISAIVR